MRILCLHGLGSNSQILEMQTAALRSELGEFDTYVFEFVDGSVPWPTARGVPRDLLSDSQSYAYYDPFDTRSILKAIVELEQYLRTTERFDGLLGFSQGATLGAMLLARHRLAPPFTFAVFICGGRPYCEVALKRGQFRFLSPEQDGRGVISIPTTHIVGADREDFENAIKLYDLCHMCGRFTCNHGGGHEIPKMPKGVTEEMARTIAKTILRVTRGQ